MRSLLGFLCLFFLLAGCSADNPGGPSVGGGGSCLNTGTCPPPAAGDPSMPVDTDMDPSTAPPPAGGDGSTAPGSGDEDQPGDPSDAGTDDGPPGDAPEPGVCSEQDVVPEGCLASDVSEAAEGLCDGADNDCDGEVDEGCSCVAGQVQRCFAGPPGRRGVGACQDGMQTCVGLEFGSWGPCEGGTQPGEEVCDGLDNDCNGCSDEIADCQPALTCPGPGDPRVPDGTPFSTYALVGSDFVSAAVASWRWEVEGTPCDRLFLSEPGSTATSENGQLSYTLRNATSETAEVDFTLSGDYRVTMTAVLEDGTEQVCSWIVNVVAPGVRVELCWDNTGPVSQDIVDVDLHLGRAGTTGMWFDSNDCYFGNCTGVLGNIQLPGIRPTWGYADSPIDNCTGPGAQGGFSDVCPNPRLDIDNVRRQDRYVPENINVDNPNNGDTFRVMVHHYSNTQPVDTHPLVNVYCGGQLRGTYGQAPDLVPNFRDGGQERGGDMWRVVDITAEVDASGTTTGCGLTPLSTASGYNVTTDDSSY